MKRAQTLPKLSKDAQARLVEFYRLLDRWDRESRQAASEKAPSRVPGRSDPGQLPAPRRGVR